jgi:ribosomal protein S18 acetylase RimI-like enzyme
VLPGLTSRPYAGESDLHRMRALLCEARSRTGRDWSHAHVGLLAWDFFMVWCHLDPRRHIRLWHEDDGRPAGYAMLGDEQLDWQVLPEHAWSGIEEEALAWGGALLAELRQEHPERWSEPLVCGARQDDAPRIAFLERHGFRYRGESAEVDMIRALDAPIPAGPAPRGFEVRALAGPEEAGERAAAEQDVWRTFTVGDVSGPQYAAFMEMPGYELDLDIIAVAADGTIAAYVNCWVDSVNRIGDLGPVGARPAFRRRGLTRAVLLEGLRRLQAAGMNRVGVSTGLANNAARPLYESVGFTEANRYLDFMR